MAQIFRSTLSQGLNTAAHWSARAETWSTWSTCHREAFLSQRQDSFLSNRNDRRQTSLHQVGQSSIFPALRNWTMDIAQLVAFTLPMLCFRPQLVSRSNVRAAKSSGCTAAGPCRNSSTMFPSTWNPWLVLSHQSRKHISRHHITGPNRPEGVLLKIMDLSSWNLPDVGAHMFQGNYTSDLSETKTAAARWTLYLLLTVEIGWYMAFSRRQSDSKPGWIEWLPNPHCRNVLLPDLLRIGQGELIMHVRTACSLGLSPVQCRARRLWNLPRALYTPSAFMSIFNRFAKSS